MESIHLAQPGSVAACVIDSQHTERDARDKAVMNARARAALAGYILHVIDDGNHGAAFLVCRWNLSRTLPDLAAVDAFLTQAGAPHA